MPFVGGDVPPPPARKRRWQDRGDHDDHDDDLYTLYRAADEYAPTARCSFGGDHPYALTARRMAPLSKRSRLGHDAAATTDEQDISDFTPSHRRRVSQQTHRQKSQSIFAAANSHADSPGRPSKHTLAPCHICHRRPTKKSDLDSFAQCEGCNEQTCFVCIRQCHGGSDMTSVFSEQTALSRSFHMEDADAPDPSETSNPDGAPSAQPPPDAAAARHTTQYWTACGHRSVVCSRCCVERGPEGEVVCMGCLVGVQSPEGMVL